MYELSQIILWILWTLRPAMAVETNLVDILNEAIAFFENPEGLDWLDEDPANCMQVSAALMDAHAKLDLMIHLRACEIAGIPHRTRTWRPTILPHHSDRTAAACWRRFVQLARRFDDAERLAHLRAIKLRREADNPLASLPLRLAASLQSTSPTQCVVEDAQHLEVLHRRRRGRWIGASSRRDGGGCALARGPPSQLAPISS